VNRAGPVDELFSIRAELSLAVDRQIRTFGQVEPDHSVDILATAPLPRPVLVPVVDLSVRVGAQLYMLSHLLALVVRQRLAHRSCQATQLGRKAFQSRWGGGVGQHHQARAALDQHTQDRAVTSTLNELASPVPGKRPAICLGRQYMDAQHLEHPPLLFTPLARSMHMLWARRRKAISPLGNYPRGMAQMQL